MGLTYIDGIEPILTKCSITAQDIRKYLEKQKEVSMPNSSELIEMWDDEKKILEEKDLRGDTWRIAYNAFMDGFARGTCVKLEKQKEQKPQGVYVDCTEHPDWYGMSPNEQKPADGRCPEKSDNWKPSEEQMEALQRAVNKLAKTDVADSVRLSIMYDNLKGIKYNTTSFGNNYTKTQR